MTLLVAQDVIPRVAPTIDGRVPGERQGEGVVLAEEAGKSEGHAVTVWIGVPNLPHLKRELTSQFGRKAHAGVICREHISKL